MSDYQDIINEYLELITCDSNECVYLGINKNLDCLPDPSTEANKAFTGKCTAFLETLEGVSTEHLSFDETLDLELAKLRVGLLLNKKIRKINQKPEVNRCPTAGEDITGGIFSIFINDPRKPVDRLHDILGRVRSIPNYLKKLTAQLDTPVKRWVDIDIEVVQGIPTLLETLLNWAKDEQFPEAEEFAGVIKVANNALEEYTQNLSKMPTTTQFAVGDEEMRRIIRLKGVRKSPEELHEIATNYIKNTRTQLDELGERLIQKYNLPSDSGHKAIHEFLNQRFCVQVKDGSLESILDTYHEQKAKILEFVQEKNLFPIMEKQEMKILRTPKFMEPSIPAGAMAPHPPFREGICVSTIYLTLGEELLDEHTELGIPLMMMHEGIPGHHLQLATSGQTPSVFRKSFDAADQAEGWATMLEDYMLDIGFMGDLTDECRFVGKRDISRIAARVAIDLCFMSGDVKYLDIGLGLQFDSDDVFVNAGKLLKEVTGFSDPRVQGELNWYSTERGYPLSYLTGNQLVWELKRDLIEAQKGKLEGLAFDRIFHKIYMEAGTMPVALLRDVFKNKGLLPE